MPFYPCRTFFSRFTFFCVICRVIKQNTQTPAESWTFKRGLFSQSCVLYFLLTLLFFVAVFSALFWVFACFGFPFDKACCCCCCRYCCCSFIVYERLKCVLLSKHSSSMWVCVFVCVVPCLFISIYNKPKKFLFTENLYQHKHIAWLWIFYGVHFIVSLEQKLSTQYPT